MNLKHVDPPRRHLVVDGHAEQVADIMLEADEQVTFCTLDGAEYDVAMKKWGLYATPSLGGRLPRLGLRPVLVRNDSGLYLMLVEIGKEESFGADMLSAGLEIYDWLDSGMAEIMQKKK